MYKLEYLTSKSEKLCSNDWLKAGLVETFEIFWLKHFRCGFLACILLFSLMLNEYPMFNLNRDLVCIYLGLICSVYKPRPFFFVLVFSGQSVHFVQCRLSSFVLIRKQYFKKFSKYVYEANLKTSLNVQFQIEILNCNYNGFSSYYTLAILAISKSYIYVVLFIQTICLNKTQDSSEQMCAHRFQG